MLRRGEPLLQYKNPEKMATIPSLYRNTFCFLLVLFHNGANSWIVCRQTSGRNLQYGECENGEELPLRNMWKKTLSP